MARSAGATGDPRSDQVTRPVRRVGWPL